MTEPTKLAIAGDWHGSGGWAAQAIWYAKKVKAADHLIQVGDFGYWLPGSGRDRYLAQVQEAADDWGIDIWWLDGNHEYHPELVDLVARNGKDHPIPLPGYDRIFYLPRGYRWSWWGKNFMALGGAFSIDRYLRTEGKGWWPEEVLTDEDVTWACHPPHGVDVIFAHDCPQGVSIPGIGPESKPRGGAEIWPPAMLHGAAQHRLKVRDVWDKHHPKFWYCGHYHVTAPEIWYGPTVFTVLNRDGTTLGENVTFLTPEELRGHT